MGTHTKRGERRKAVLLRLTAAEHAALRTLAEAAGQNQSQFVRGALYSVPGFVAAKGGAR